VDSAAALNQLKVEIGQYRRAFSTTEITWAWLWARWLTSVITLHRQS